MEIRTKKFVPECFGEEYDGHVLVKKMTHVELEENMEKLGLLDVKEGEVKTPKENFMWLRKAFEMAQPYLISADVVRKSDGFKLNLEDLMYETELKAFRSDIAAGFMGGWAMGNEKGQAPV